jgi:1-deoxy-D-xylulose-5-phosphate reductoisomerase
MPCIVNAANEIVNAAFRRGECSFLDIGDIIEKTMQRATFDANPDYDVYVKTDAEARKIASSLIHNS